MGRVLLVGFGGFLGTVLRYGLGGAVSRMKHGATFPYETLLINVTGCLAFGLLAGLAETRGVFSGTVRSFLFVGVLGGFSTFSSFGYETFQLLRDGQFPAAFLSVGLQVVVGIGAVWAGHRTAVMAWGG